MTTSHRPPLNDLVIVDMSAGIAGSYCTKMLVDAGATVIRVETPDGDDLRGWSASGAAASHDGDAPLFQYLSAGKSSVTIDPESADDLDRLTSLLHTADAAVWSRDTPFSTLTGGRSVHPSALHVAHPQLVVTAISPFGLDGEWADLPATEFTVQAWSGGTVGLGRGAPDRAPVHVGGQIGEWYTGATAAAATLIALRARGDSAVGEIVDVSLLESSVCGLTYHPVSFFEMRSRPFRSERSVFVPGVAKAKDGMVAVGCATAQQWFDLCVMVGHPEWIDRENMLAITETASKVAPEIYAWFAEHTVAEISDLASAFRIPNAPVGNGATLPEFPHHQQRGTFVTNPSGGFIQPRTPYRMSGVDLPRPRRAPEAGQPGDSLLDGSSVSGSSGGSRAPEGAPFAGLRVLDMTAFWAGPSCTHVLAMLGAEVIHIESPTRPDGTRMIAGVPMSEDQWWEKSPIFSGLNANKKSVTVNIQTERGQQILRDLIATCDVIVENYTPRVLDQIGLDYQSVKRIRPDIVMVRMPGFGLDGEWRDKAAFAFVIEDASGLTWLTGHPDQNPIEPYAIGDPNAGIHALVALLVALRHRGSTGEGALVEACMVDAALNVAAEQVVEASAYGQVLQRQGNRGPAACPQNLYKTAGLDEFGREDRWVAVAVATDDQWSALRSALGNPGWAAADDLATAAGRRRAQDDIDRGLAEWCAARADDEVVSTLWAAGVPVAKVMQPHRQTELAPLADRNFFELAEHPVNGPARHATIPMRFSSGPARYAVRGGPLLGEHNTEVLGALGLSATDFEQLEAEKVIGTAPAF